MNTHTHHRCAMCHVLLEGLVSTCARIHLPIVRMGVCCGLSGCALSQTCLWTTNTGERAGENRLLLQRCCVCERPNSGGGFLNPISIPFSLCRASLWYTHAMGGVMPLPLSSLHFFSCTFFLKVSFVPTRTSPESANSSSGEPCLRHLGVSGDRECSIRVLFCQLPQNAPGCQGDLCVNC